MNVGPLEVLIIAIFGLIVFGPKRLPDIARTIGKAFGELRRVTSDFKEEFSSGFESAIGQDPTPPDRQTPLDTQDEPTPIRFPPPGPR